MLRTSTLVVFVCGAQIASASVSIGTVSITELINNCTVVGQFQSSDVLELKAPITNNEGVMTMFRVLVRMRALNATSETVDANYTGPLYVQGLATAQGFDDSYGLVFNTPAIANGATYTVTARLGLHNQFLGAIGIPNNGSGTINVDVEVYKYDMAGAAGFLAAASTPITAYRRNTCGNSTSGTLVTDRVVYDSVGDVVTIEWGSAGCDARPAFSEESAATVDVRRMTGVPSGDPVADFGGATNVASISTWTAHDMPDDGCIVDEGVARTFCYSDQIGTVQSASLYNTYTTQTDDENKYLIIRLPIGAGTASHPIRAAQYNYIFVGNPLAGDQLDLGDAPDPSYPTLLASDGARHITGSAVYLGAGVDAELDGQPNAGATGDDLAGDDEDGVTFTSPLVPGLNASVTVVASVAGILNAWIDFNGDGDWADTGEQIFTDQALVAGSNNLSIAVPADAASATTYARFRFATVGGLTYTGSAPDGEVEDYQVSIDQALDFGDAPDPTFPTLLANDGARHVLDGMTYLGAGVDAETNGQPTAAADGDDLAGDDEDGVTFTTSLVPGLNASVTVVASVNGVLNAWVDFNGDGDWADAGEQIFVDQALVAGSNNLTIAVPGTAVSGTTYARFRFATVGGLTYTGSASNGEVEDYQVAIEQALDFGDAPDPTFPTLLASNGARHVLDGVTYLGASVDADSDGQPHGAALGDDLGPTDDEDGVVFTSLLIPGNNASVTVTASVAGVLNAWIDFNGDGDWDDLGEQIFADQALAGGPNALTFAVPMGIPTGQKIGRFRFSTASGIGYLDLAPDGEVEDHAVNVDVPIELGSLTATVRGTSVVVSWVTHSENENLGYRVYRSSGDGATYSPITNDLIPGAGTSLESHEYSFVDETVTPGMTYSYKLSDVSASGVEVFHGPITVAVPALPTVATLDLPYPHPVAGSATLRFALPETGTVRLALYDMAGRERRLLVNEVRPAGWHSVDLSIGRNGERLSAGVYVLRLQTMASSLTRQVVITD